MHRTTHHPPREYQSRGAITKVFNHGLRVPQQKDFTYYNYNDGCYDGWSTGPAGGGIVLGVVGAKHDTGVFARGLAPLVDRRHDYATSKDTEGIKYGTRNGVSGWSMQHSQQ